METFLFDFDGTLVDSMPTFTSVMIRILDEHNIIYPNDIVKIITPLGYKGTAEYFISLGIKTPLPALMAQMNSYAQKEYENSIPAKKNVVEVLKKLKDKGVSLNVLTASPHAMLDCCLKRLNLFHLFDNVWSCDDFNTTKADPKIYKMAADKLGKNVKDVLFFDDNLGAISTAKSAGMRVCGVYDDSSKDCVSKMQKIADKYIFDFIELLN
jgi:HAD superfamily hydrolase (TIGR01509 family)